MRGKLSFALPFLALVVALGLLLVGCSGTGTGKSRNSVAGSSASTSTPSGGTDVGTTDAQRLIEVKCSQCHTLDRVWAAKKSRDQWVTTVDRMKRNGLVVTDAEYAAIIDHLASLSKQ